MSLGALKGQLTKLLKKIEETTIAGQNLYSEDVSGSNRSTYRENIKSKINMLKELQSRYETVCNSIDELTGDTDGSVAHGEDTMEKILQMSENISNLSSRLETIDIQLKTDPLAEPQKTSVEAQLERLIALETARSQRPVNAETSVSLPKLDFAPFYGDVLKWNEFWDSFVAAVDNSSSLQPVQKLAYLMSKLRGEAKAVVTGFNTTNENYGVVVDLLRERFGDQQTAITAHYSKIMEMQPATNAVDKVRSLHDELEQHLRCLAALGEDTNHRHFISLIMTKLPKEVITRLEEMKGTEEAWTVESLRSKLRNHLVARESADRQSVRTYSQPAKAERCIPKSSTTCYGAPPGSSSRSYDNRRSEPRSNYATADTLYASERERNARNSASKMTCAFCHGKHWSDECHRFKTSDSRKKKLTEEKRCFNCLGSDHNVRNCRSKRPCYYCKKTNSHHSSLCLKKFGAEKENAHVVADNDEDDPADESLLAGGERALLQTAMVNAISKRSSQRIQLRLLLDSGSHRSYVSQDAVRKLGLKPSGSEIISVNTFGATKSKNVETKVVKIDLELQNKSNMAIVVNVVPTISAAIRRQPLDVSKYKGALKGLKLADTIPKTQEETTIDILIGSDYYMELLTFEKKQLGDGLHLLGSKFGWILTGRMPKDGTTCKDQTMLILNATNQSQAMLRQFTAPDKSLPLDPSTDDFWSLEAIGINDDSKVDQSDEEAIRCFNDSVTCEGQRYFVKWPWKQDFPNLPSNFELSCGRLNSLVRRLSRSPELMKQYDNIIRDQLSKNIIEPVDEKDEAKLVHYIPHQAVITPQKTTTKVRIVYDASAKTRKDSSSLNECLFRGPVLLENLCGLLIRFRLNRIAVVADIEKAFLQVGLQIPDRDVVRFLWLKDPTKFTTTNNIQTFRFCRVPFGVITSPFLLAATVSHHLKQAATPIARQISENMYVDNMITGVDTPEQALQLYKEGKSLFENASMNLREWTSNCKQFTNSIPQKDRCADAVMKVLGMAWEIQTDKFKYHVSKNDATTDDFTKRDVFKMASAIFDPLGLVAPVLIRGKMFIQELWLEGLKWDDKLSTEQTAKWKEILEDARKTSDVSIERFVGPTFQITNGKFSLVAFCDASAKAYACCIYLRWVNEEGTIDTCLTFAKSRLAPTKRQTIPRLELLAALIGIRALKFVEAQIKIPISKKYLWSDSQCVLRWIQSTKLQPVFIQNRIKEIKQSKDVQFRYVTSEQNPADLPSRGTTVAELQNNALWWKGPCWLRTFSNNWPRWKITPEKDSCAQKVGPKVLFEASLLGSEKSSLNLAPFDMSPDRYSTLTKLLRVTAWCQRFIHKLKKQNNGLPKFLSSDEITFARQLWEKAVQRQRFQEAFEALSKGKKNEMVSKFDLRVTSDEILRCGGRLQLIEMPTSAKFPKLIPKDDPFSTLIIKDIHWKLHHAGVSHTLARLRQEYWIPEGRRQVQKVLAKCVTCKRWGGGPYKVPAMPELPKSRVVPANPFTNTGVDYFGPLYVKAKEGQSKVWVSLFTCMTVRAVHLELVPNLTAEEFILSFRRFVARRGCPKQVFSDNATNFHAASDVVVTFWQDVFQSPDVHSYFSTSGIRWKFIPQSAPWMGGFYERLIGVVKKSLRKALGKISMTVNQLQTLLAEIEAVINSRPLTYVGHEFPQGYPLSPSHFLSVNPDLGVPSSSLQFETDGKDPDYTPEENPHTILLRSWIKGRNRLDKFWADWSNKYLLSLRERFQRLVKQPRVQEKRLPNVGDVVLVKDETLPRGSWKVAKIQELLPSSDGQYRAAKILLSSRKETIRPLALLHPFECANNSASPKNTEGQLNEKESIKPNSNFIQGDITSMPLTTPGEEHFPTMPVRLRREQSDYDVAAKEVLTLPKIPNNDDEFLPIVSYEKATYASTAVNSTLRGNPIAINLSPRLNPLGQKSRTRTISPVMKFKPAKRQAARKAMFNIQAWLKEKN